MTKKQADYLSYLLRLWRVNGDEDHDETYQPIWRASLEDPETGECQGFADLKRLFVYLKEKTESLTGCEWKEELGDLGERSNAKGNENHHTNASTDGESKNTTSA